MFRVSPNTATPISSIRPAKNIGIAKRINISGDNKGLWDYRNGIGERIDHSVSQYGILGLWALQDSGAKVDLHYWQLFDQTWRDHQLYDGGWAYNLTFSHISAMLL